MSSSPGRTSGRSGSTYRAARTVATALAVILGVYLVLRAAVEPFVIDMTDPSSYRTGWGGPTLAGVLTVHMLPGVVSLGLLIGWWRSRLRAQSRPRVTALSD
ncbi:MAG: hypothetical protein L0I76_34725 [Pseudonocardia sp.]|nr:hypothetical protein [Pseudonocardia sp.]